MTKITLICTIFFLALSSFINLTKLTPKLPKEYVYIPAGTFWDGDTETGKRVSLWSYYMSKYEITNKQYREFLNEVCQNSTKEEFEKIKIDSSGLDIPYSYGEPYFKPNYFTHPAYNYYPVVNLRYQGALKYCEWLQQKIQKDNPNFFITIKLPSCLQWTYAARAGRSNAIYPWSGNYLRDKNGKFLCNFNFVDESAIVSNRETGKPEIINSLANHKHMFATDNVGSYFPNNFGLYNMSGNIAEMVDSIGICMGGSWKDYGGDVKVTSTSNYYKPSSSVGFRPIIIVQEIP
jgi:formylglycine-generating enzyme required for sulfatase activity